MKWKEKKVTAATRVPTKIYESPKQCHSVAAELSFQKINFDLITNIF